MLAQVPVMFGRPLDAWTVSEAAAKLDIMISQAFMVITKL